MVLTNNRKGDDQYIFMYAHKKKKKEKNIGKRIYSLISYHLKVDEGYLLKVYQIRISEPL